MKIVTLKSTEQIFALCFFVDYFLYYFNHKSEQASDGI